MISRPMTSWALRPRAYPALQQFPRSAAPPQLDFRALASRASDQQQPTSKGCNMINRRLVLASIASVAFAASASAEDWKAKYPEITFAVVPAENASGVS